MQINFNLYFDYIHRYNYHIAEEGLYLLHVLLYFDNLGTTPFLLRELEAKCTKAF